MEIETAGHAAKHGVLIGFRLIEHRVVQSHFKVDMTGSVFQKTHRWQMCAAPL